MRQASTAPCGPNRPAPRPQWRTSGIVRSRQRSTAPASPATVHRTPWRRRLRNHRADRLMTAAVATDRLHHRCDVLQDRRDPEPICDEPAELERFRRAVGAPTRPVFATGPQGTRSPDRVSPPWARSPQRRHPPRFSAACPRSRFDRSQQAPAGESSYRLKGMPKLELTT